MAQVLDLIGSSIIAGLLLITALSLNASVMESTVVHNQNLYIQQEAALLNELLDHDLNVIGYRDSSKSRIKTATPNSLVFRADIDFNGRADTVAYYYTRGSDVPGVLATWGFTAQHLPVNPTDSVLYRFTSSNAGGGRGIPTLITSKARNFSFTYMTRRHVSLGATPAQKDSIRLIGVALELNDAEQGTESNDALIHWQKIYRPKNLDY